MNSLEFDQDKTIEPTQLDVEATRQAETFFKWAQRAVHARDELDRLEFELKVLESRLQMEAREFPDRFNIKNPTETAIKAAVQCSDKYIAAMRGVFVSRTESALLDRAVSALEQRKRMIEVLITLHGQQYFASPATPRDIGQVWSEHQRRRTEDVNDKQRAGARRRVRKDED